MKKKDLIKKWLDNEPLTNEESEAFKNLDAYDSYMKISETAKKISIPEYSIEENLQNLQGKLSERQKPSSTRNNLALIYRIAAVLILVLGTYLFFSTKNGVTVDTLAGQKISVQLPDHTTVELNALSSIEYQEKDWENNREVKLDGEAYFKVEKGKKFDVLTASGVVSVLGTEFNVKHRKDYFEVVCYEGLVSVTYANKTVKLPAGKHFRVLQKEISSTDTSLTQPNWISNRSTFASTPYKYILREFERQYDVKIIAKNLDTDKLFTGNFVHSNIQTALQSITIPMRLKYEINGNNITLFKQ